MGLMCTLFSFVSLNKTSLLSSSIFLPEPASNWKKTSKGCVEKEAETKLSIQYIKSNIQQ